MTFLIFIIEIAVLIAIILGTDRIDTGCKKDSGEYAKQIVGNRQFGGARQFLPIKSEWCRCYADHLCAGNHVPTNTCYTWESNHRVQTLSTIFTDHQNVWYMMIYSVVVIGFTFFIRPYI